VEGWFVGDGWKASVSLYQMQYDNVRVSAASKWWNLSSRIYSIPIMVVPSSS